MKASLYPLEFVYIWNKNSGHRISTYVIYGEPGSRCCILNGAAARTCQNGDSVIICASEYIDSHEKLCSVRPNVLTFDENNNIVEHFQYEVSSSPDFAYTFKINKLSA
jgi:aspartate 1-decarboxylase